MNLRPKRVGLTAVAVGLLSAASLAIAAPAMAATFAGQNVPTITTMTPNSVSNLDWTYKNTGGQAGLDSGTITFTAPANTTFTPQTTVATSYSANGSSYGPNNARLTGCVVSGDALSLTCQLGHGSGSTSGWPAGSFWRFSPQLKANAVLPVATVSSPASFSFHTVAGADYTITDGTLDVRTQPTVTADLSLAQPSVPTIAPSGTGSVSFTVTNNGPDGMNGNDVYQPLVIQAPADTTFTGLPTYVLQSGQTGTVPNCSLSGDNRTITCTFGQLTGGTNQSGLLATVTVPVAVDADAPHGTTLSGGSVTWTEGTSNGHSWTDPNQANNTNIPLAVITPIDVETPIVDPLIASGAGALVLLAVGLVALRKRRLGA